MFQFKQFIINQDECAMKVGTDGVLLGAWAMGGSRVLDVGTGTGIIAIMMAQRYAEADILAIDIDEGSVHQAKDNVAASPYVSRINVSQIINFALFIMQIFLINVPIKLNFIIFFLVTWDIIFFVLNQIFVI